MSLATATINCPRCGSQKVGFEVTSFNGASNGQLELFCRCNHCKDSTIFSIFVRSFYKDRVLKEIMEGGHINEYIESFTPLRIPADGVVAAPKHIPEKIKNVFDEGALCFAHSCQNAASAMFRASIEQALKDVFSKELDEAPKKLHTLFSKVKYLSESGLLSETLAELADCIREDGNDALHECNVDANTAEDMQEFCVLILSQLYTEPAKLRLAKERREERRRKSSEAEG